MYTYVHVHNTVISDALAFEVMAGHTGLSLQPYIQPREERGGEGRRGEGRGEGRGRGGEGRGGEGRGGEGRGGEGREESDILKIFSPKLYAETHFSVCICECVYVYVRICM